MQLWIQWWKMVAQFRPTCSRFRTFLWLGVVLIGFTIRADFLGVTSIIRALGLMEGCYDRLLDFFHSPALSLHLLSLQWIRIVVQRFPILKKHGRIVLVGDGLKVPKSGKKMPGVKKLFQESESNTKPKYIFGHSYQTIAVLAGTIHSLFAVPLISRIHEGFLLSNRDKRTLIDKMVELQNSIAVAGSYYFLADAYYASKTMIHGVLKEGNHLISRVRSNAVAYELAGVSQKSRNKSKRGRPKKYGEKIKLNTLWKQTDLLQQAPSPLKGEENVLVRFRVCDLIWKRAGAIVRFVAVLHPLKGNILLMSTDLTLSAMDIIELYSFRYKIELSFKQAIHTVGAYAYHFWMRAMSPITRKGKKQFLHRKSDGYRINYMRKLEAYHRFVQIGIIAQGLLQYLSCCHTKLVWNSFGSWIRTIRPGILPSEMVTSIAMKNTFPYFLAGYGRKLNIVKFILSKIDVERAEGARLAA